MITLVDVNDNFVSLSSSSYSTPPLISIALRLLEESGRKSTTLMKGSDSPLFIELPRLLEPHLTNLLE